MKITVFTPTYNRAYIIENLYRSLQRQTCLDFEWLVVDDGSTDNTAELFAQWMQEHNPFPIRYYTQPNGGKHRAINKGVPLAAGELFFIVDSDDFLEDRAVEVMCQQLDTLPCSTAHKFAGICNLKASPAYHPLGSSFSGDFIDCTALDRDRYNISGDKAEAFFTSVMRRYPFPEFEGEKFVTEAVVWDRMAMDGLIIRFFNEITYLCEYLDDGLTSLGLDLYYQNPCGYGCYLKQCRQNGKFEPGLQRYFDTQCVLSWHNKISFRQISSLLGISPMRLAAETAFSIAWETGSKIKHLLIGDKK